jgi:enoyl-CoA hydratase/carnithine racemase
VETIDVQRTDGIVTITLSRPEKKNAINGVMWDELLATFREIGASSTDRAVVITGAGGALAGAGLTAIGSAVGPAGSPGGGESMGSTLGSMGSTLMRALSSKTPHRAGDSASVLIRAH